MKTEALSECQDSFVQRSRLKGKIIRVKNKLFQPRKAKHASGLNKDITLYTAFYSKAGVCDSASVQQILLWCIFGPPRFHGFDPKVRLFSCLFCFLLQPKGIGQVAATKASSFPSIFSQLALSEMRFAQQRGALLKLDRMECLATQLFRCKREPTEMELQHFIGKQQHIWSSNGRGSKPRVPFWGKLLSH